MCAAVKGDFDPLFVCALCPAATKFRLSIRRASVEREYLRQRKRAQATASKLEIKKGPGPKPEALKICSTRVDRVKENRTPVIKRGFVMSEEYHAKVCCKRP